MHRKAGLIYTFYIFYTAIKYDTRRHCSLRRRVRVAAFLRGERRYRDKEEKRRNMRVRNPGESLLCACDAPPVGDGKPRGEAARSAEERKSGQ